MNEKIQKIQIMKYSGGYKYQSHIDVTFKTNIIPESNIDTDYICLNTNGVLIVKKGYAWDGPSGPSWDTKTFMRGSLAHDALYQLMCEGLLDIKWRQKADELLVDVCKQDGMNWFRRKYVYYGVRVFGGNHITAKEIYGD